MKARFSLPVLLLLALTASDGWAGHTLSAQQQRTVADWLSAHPTYRQATPADCNCDEDIRREREESAGPWKAVPDYTPYVATGDFNGDGVEDFAVVVIDSGLKTDTFALLIFNGPLTKRHQPPAFVMRQLNLEYMGLFYGPPRPRPYRLGVGRFESEGALFEPKGRTYKFSPFTGY